MTRMVVAIEGIKTLDGHLIVPGAVKPRSNTIPVLYFSGSEVIGKATSFERDEKTGELSFDILTRGGVHKDMDAHIFVVNAEWENDDGDSLVLTSGLISEVALTRTWTHT